MNFSHSNYTVIRELGHGASARVYLAVEKSLNREVALKVIDHSQISATDHQRFRREARILARLNHPNIVPVFGLFETDSGENTVMVMRYISGGTLRERIEQLSLAQGLRVIIDIAGALEYAHVQGFLHRDVKPQNILFDADRALLVDFGIARATDSRTQLTRTGATLGTADYMSPEQISGANLDARCDVYSLGVVLYEMLAGAVPFSHDSAVTTGVMHLTTPVPPLPENLRSFQACIDSALAKNPDNRPQSASALADHLTCLMEELHLPFDEPIGQIRGQRHRASAAPVLAKPERRQISIMSCAIAGYAALSRETDPEDLYEFAARFRRVAEAAIFRFNGHLAQFSDGRLIAYFGYPSAHENDTSHAIFAGLQIASKLAAQNLDFNATDLRHRLRVQIGINTGPVVFSASDSALFQEQVATGETPTIAEAIQRAAPEGCVIVAASTMNIAQSAFEFTPFTAQGHDDSELGPQVLYRVAGVRSSASRFLAARNANDTRLFGRESELARLESAWQSALGGRGHVLVVRGDAGIGKSCLVNALSDRVRKDGAAGIVYQCSPYYSDTALYPVLQQLKRFAGIDPNATASDRLGRLADALSLDEHRLPDALALLAPLFAIDANDLPDLSGRFETSQVQREFTLQVLVEHLRNVATTNTLLLIIEDAHWIDPTTLALIDRLRSDVEQRHLLCVMTSRPPFEPALLDSPGASLLRVERLPETVIEEIITHTAGNQHLPRAMLEHIVAKTDGVPLFAEELTKTLLETTTLSEGSLDRHAIPGSLHDSLVARLDRMRSIKPVLQAAACIGREFSFAVLNQISPLVDGELRNALDQMEQSSLVFRQSLGLEPGYIFKHALLRDAAYDSLLKSERRTIHAKLFEYLRSDQNAGPEILAFHAAQAERYEDALALWEEAGMRAMEQASFTEAIAHFASGAECAKLLPDSEQARLLELNLHVKQSHASTAVNGFAHPTTVKANIAARALLNTVGESPYRFPVLYGHWVIMHAAGQHPAALQNAREMAAEAEREDDRIQRSIAYRTLGASQTMMGDYVGALEQFEAFHRVHDVTKDAGLAWQYGLDFSVSAGVNHAFVLVCTGETGEATARIEKLYHYAVDLDHGNTLAYTLAHIPFLGQLGQLDGLTRYIEIANAFIDKHDLVAYKGHCRGSRAMYLYHKKAYAAAAKEMSNALSIIKETKTDIYTPLLLGNYCACLAELDRYKEAREAAAAALAMAERGKEYWAISEIKRYIAISRLRESGWNSDADASFREALNDANRRGARLWALRIAVTFARALIEQGETDRARQLVTEAANNMPESGTSSHDMREAQRILKIAR